MKSNLIALAVAALVGGMLVVPLTHQSAMAQVHAGIKGLGSTGGTPTTGTANERGDVILVGRGGGKGGGGRGGGGRGFGGGHHGGGKAFSGGGRGGGGLAATLRRISMSPLGWTASRALAEASALPPSKARKMK